MRAVLRSGTRAPVVMAVMAGLLVATALPSAAFAADPLGFANCNAKPTKSDTAEAKRSYERGKKLFDERDRGAIDLFRSAYLADCTKHELLVVLSFAYQSDGQLKEALGASELYLEKRNHALTGEDRKTVEDRIASLKAKVKEQEDAAIEAAKPKTTVVQPPPKATPEEQGGKRSKLPWVLVGVGAASIVTGAILFPLGRSQVPEGCRNGGGDLFSNGDCDPNTDKIKERQDQVDAGKAFGMQRAGFITMVAGGAAVVGGLIWFGVDSSSSSSSARRKIVPNVGLNYLGMSGTF